MAVQKYWVSEYQLNLLHKDGEVEKLVPNLINKEEHEVHCRNLLLYISLGMKLTKIRRELELEQKTWMEPYIRMYTDLRKLATKCFEKDPY